MIKLNAAQLRQTRAIPQEKKKIRRNPIYIVLDNVLDTYNIGSIFRLADAVAAKQVIICGQSEVPPNTRIKKASINTTEWINWKYESNTKEAILKLKKQHPKLKLFAIEQGKESINYEQVNFEFPLALVVGNETYGISKEVLEVCDQIVEIPMWGINKSLNVMVSLAIVLYRVMEERPL